MPSLTQARLKELLSYSPETGAFVWLASNSNRAVSGQLAGSIGLKGYRTITINKRQYKAHRLAFLYMTGKMPAYIVDHIDTERANNSWANLRELTNADNIRRQASNSRNTSGTKNVSWSKRAQKWLVQMRVSSIRLNGGLFAELAEAVSAAKVLQAKHCA